jgi:GAF domain-containing protein
MKSITSVNGRDALLDQQTAITELATILINDETLRGVPDKVAALAKGCIPGADEVSITLIAKDTAYTAAATGELASGLDQHQYDCGHGPCLDAATGGRTITVDDTATDQTYRDFARRAHQAGVRRSMSVPLTARIGSIGALNVYDTGQAGVQGAGHDTSRSGNWRSLLPKAASDPAENFAACAAVTLANAAAYARHAQLAQQLLQAMESRPLIEQAKGILIRDNRCSAEEAFTMLIQASNRSNRKLRDVARSMVEATQRGR